MTIIYSTRVVLVKAKQLVAAMQGPGSGVTALVLIAMANSMLAADCRIIVPVFPHLLGVAL